MIELVQIHLVLLPSDLIGELSRALAKVVVWHDVRKESLDRLYDVELPWVPRDLLEMSAFLGDDIAFELDGYENAKGFGAVKSSGKSWS